MRYDLRVSNIRSDFTIDSDLSEDWTQSTESDDELILLLNRVAIATTQYPVVDFPEIEITTEITRALVRAIDGQLFYSELGSTSRRDLKVIPVEVQRLLKGQTLEQAFEREPEEEAYDHSSVNLGRGSPRNFRTIMLIGAFALILGSAWSILRSVKFNPSLIEVPQFVAVVENEGSLLREYADVFVSDLREGSMVLELTATGQLSIYELWYSGERNRYILMPIEQHSVVGGLSQDEPAFLAGNMHLIQLRGDDVIMHDIVFSRYGKKLSDIGEVLEAAQKL